MDLNADHFAGMGDAYLFAQVCDRFLGLYATINGFTQLTVRMTQSGDVYTFPPRCGEQMTPADRRQDR
jgi:type VI secretion system protein ImpG